MSRICLFIGIHSLDLTGGEGREGWDYSRRTNPLWSGVVSPFGLVEGFCNNDRGQGMWKPGDTSADLVVWRLLRVVYPRRRLVFGHNEPLSHG